MEKEYIEFLTIDSIRLKYKFNSIIEYNNSISFLESKLERIRLISNRQNKLPTLTGYLQGMKMIVTPDCVTIRGSLCKFSLGNNYQSQTIQEMQKAFLSLADSIQLPLLDAQILRIDFGTCMIMEHPPEIYYPALGICGSYECWTRTHSVYYETSYKVMVFYNKYKEVEANRDQTLLKQMHPYVIRFEIRFIRDLPAQFRRQKICGKDLFDIQFHKDLTYKWLNEYNRIHKNKVLSPIKEELSSGCGIDYTLSALIELQGQNNLTKITNILKHKFKTGAFARYNKKLKNLKYLSQENPLITELDAKVLEIVNNTLKFNDIDA